MILAKRLHKTRDERRGKRESSRIGQTRLLPRYLRPTCTHASIYQTPTSLAVTRERAGKRGPAPKRRKQDEEFFQRASSILSLRRATAAMTSSRPTRGIAQTLQTTLVGQTTTCVCAIAFYIARVSKFISKVEPRVRWDFAAIFSRSRIFDKLFFSSVVNVPMI